MLLISVKFLSLFLFCVF